MNNNSGHKFLSKRFGVTVIILVIGLVLFIVFLSSQLSPSPSLLVTPPSLDEPAPLGPPPSFPLEPGVSPPPSFPFIPLPASDF